MKFSTRTRYGIRAVLEIAMSESDNGIYQKEISEHQDISYKYLDHIINSLKVAGIITKASGRKSGYILTRDPKDITIYDIHKAFEPEICVIDCLAMNTYCEREKYCALKGFWGRLNNHIIDYFQSTTIQDLMEEQVKLEDLAGITR
jgi:Rrf2 family protein